MLFSYTEQSLGAERERSGAGLESIERSGAGAAVLEFSEA